MQFTQLLRPGQCVSLNPWLICIRTCASEEFAKLNARASEVQRSGASCRVLTLAVWRDYVSKCGDADLAEEVQDWGFDAKFDR